MERKTTNLSFQRLARHYLILPVIHTCIKKCHKFPGFQTKLTAVA